jgi:hypothetical protein
MSTGLSELTMKIEAKEAILKKLNRMIHLLLNSMVVLILILFAIPGSIIFTIIFLGLIAVIAINASREHIDEEIEVKLYGKTKEIH